jgi:transposase-like protein
MATVPALVDRTPAQRFAEIRDEEVLWGDLRPELARLVKTVLETTMEDELRLAVGALRYERTSGRRDHRNGCYRRSLVTELGLIEELAVPRARELRSRP